MKVGDWVRYAALGGVAYVAYLAIKQLGAVGQTAKNVGEAISGKLFDWTHPYDPRSDTFYTVSFPNGQRHAIQASSVADDGGFSYQGAGYVIKVDAQGFHHAVPA